MPDDEAWEEWFKVWGNKPVKKETDTDEGNYSGTVSGTSTRGMRSNRSNTMGNDKLNQFVQKAMDKAREEFELRQPTVIVAARQDDVAFIDIRMYPGRNLHSNFPVEIEMRSGNPANDGLVLNTTLARITIEQALVLRDRLTELIEDTMSEHLDKNIGW